MTIWKIARLSITGNFAKKVVYAAQVFYKTSHYCINSVKTKIVYAINL